MKFGNNDNEWNPHFQDKICWHRQILISNSSPLSLDEEGKEDEEEEGEEDEGERKNGNEKCLLRLRNFLCIQANLRAQLRIYIQRFECDGEPSSNFIMNAFLIL